MYTSKNPNLHPIKNTHIYQNQYIKIYQKSEKKLTKKNILTRNVTIYLWQQK